jgi:hypothetical protein
VAQLAAGITDARMEAPFEPGTSFDSTSYGFSVRSTIYDVDARAPVLWGGTAAGAVALGVAEAPVSSAQECSRPARR